MEPTQRVQTRPDGTTFEPKLVDGLEHLQSLKRENRYEYDYVVDFQREDSAAAPSAENGPESDEQVVAARELGRRSDVHVKEDGKKG